MNDVLTVISSKQSPVAIPSGRPRSCLTHNGAYLGSDLSRTTPIQDTLSCSCPVYSPLAYLHLFCSVPLPTLFENINLISVRLLGVLFGPNYNTLFAFSDCLITFSLQRSNGTNILFYLKRVW